MQPSLPRKASAALVGALFHSDELHLPQANAVAAGGARVAEEVAGNRHLDRVGAKRASQREDRIPLAAPPQLGDGNGSAEGGAVVGREGDTQGFRLAVTEASGLIAPDDQIGERERAAE